MVAYRIFALRHGSYEIIHGLIIVSVVILECFKQIDSFLFPDGFVGY